MSQEGDTSEPTDPNDRRRRLLGYIALLTIGGTGLAGAWYANRDDDDRPTETTTTTTTQNTVATPESPTIPERVRRYAPDIYFGELERWFPTDPTEFLPNPTDTTLHGFDALDGYTRRYEETGSPPYPTVYYHETEAAPGVDAIQYWMYSVFDQFTVNFHWHDWELLQVFVDQETDDPLLVSASAHSRRVPNNEFLDPAAPTDRRPGILAEVGSHSSASELNANVPSFDRVDVGDAPPDVTNDFVGLTPGLSTRLAYGLPRDEGARLPFVLPELDDHALHEHPDLSVGRDAFIDESVTVHDWRGLPTPPAAIPLREDGLVMGYEDSTAAIDVPYELAHISEVSETIDEFEGPQLSFQFHIPGFVEDRVAHHIKSVGIPWQQDRFTDPLDDVTDPQHRAFIDGQQPSDLRDIVVGHVQHLQSGAEGALDHVPDALRDTLASDITVSLGGLPVEVAIRLASPDPDATVTRGGTFALQRVDPGEHELLVNGPGYAPVAERFTHEGGTHRVGANGTIGIVANEDAAWITGDARDDRGLKRVRVIEDYTGLLSDAPPFEPDRFKIAVHRDGHYTVELTDQHGRQGAHRVTPADFERTPETELSTDTGKLPLIQTLLHHLTDLQDLARTLAERDDARGITLEGLSDATQHARDAEAAAEETIPERANESLRRVIDALETALETLISDRQDGYSDESVAVLQPRVLRLIGRTETALETELGDDED